MKLVFFTTFFLISAVTHAGLELIESKCCRCHRPGKEKGGLDLKSIMSDGRGHLQSPQKWERALAYLKSHEMPPQDSKAITKGDRLAMSTWLEKNLIKTYLSTNPELKTPAPRRLNNTEYINTLQDLLFLEEKPRFNLPTDNSGYGFDNISELLSVSSLSMEKYLKFSRILLDKAIMEELPQKQHWNFDAESMLRKPKSSGRIIHDIHHLWSHGALSVRFNSLYSGNFKIKMEAAGDQAGGERVKVAVELNKQKIKVVEVAAEDPHSAVYSLGGEIRVGENELTVSFINDYNHPIDGDRNFHFHGLSIEGPEKLPKLPQSHLKLVPNEEDVEMTLGRFMRRAYRRPISDYELNKFQSNYNKLRSEGQAHLPALKTCFLAILVSPKFLFRVEKKPNEGVMPLDDYELASRLSYFLWSTMPDERLHYLAKNGQLSDKNVLREEVKKMLASYRSKQFIKNFAGQWLHVRNLDYVDVSNREFKAWNGALKTSMAMEVYEYFSYVLKNNLPLSYFIKGDQQFLNEKLAQHYGVEGNFNWQIKQVPAKKNRNSILTSASVLTVTSEASRTSPVKRGKWILEEILGFTPPPPPPGVTELEENSQDHGVLTISQQLAKHREDPDCAVCHLRMDPIGLSFENFDAIGRWRDKYDEDISIDVGGMLPDGFVLGSVSDLQNYLLSNKTDFEINLIKKLMIYSFGRGLEDGDYKTLHEIYQKTATQDCRLEDIITEIVLSKAFMYKS